MPRHGYALDVAGECFGDGCPLHYEWALTAPDGTHAGGGTGGRPAHPSNTEAAAVLYAVGTGLRHLLDRLRRQGDAGRYWPGVAVRVSRADVAAWLCLPAVPGPLAVLHGRVQALALELCDLGPWGVVAPEYATERTR